MYSPKISEDLIPVLYREAKQQGVPMTKLVDVIIRKAVGPQLLNSHIKSEGSDQVILPQQVAS